LFSFVLKKFFTSRRENENKGATDTSRQEPAMIATLRNTARRNAHTLAEDALGAVALIVTLVAGLHLPMVF
jgi:hypothetical protein